MPKIYHLTLPIENLSLGYFLTQIPPHSSVLEFGPGCGHMTKYLKEELKCKVTCIELIPEMAKMAALYAEKMIISNIDEGEWEKEITGTFDYILFGDVLEHLKKPDLAIEKAIKILSPDGFIISSIPNISHNAIIMSLRHGKFQYTDFGLLDNTHIHFFTREEMNRIFNEKGLHCVEEKSIFKRPSSIEPQEFYIQNISLIYPLIRRRDGHIFQFVCKWSQKENSSSNQSAKGIRLSIAQALFCLFVDINDYLAKRWNFKFALPRFLKPHNRRFY
ncbi:MAG: class I SAM-dependent methyltransferase [Odoribacter sp.]